MLLWSLGALAISATTVGLLAHFCAKRRAAVVFLVVIALACGVASWMLGHDSSTTSLRPGRIPEWRYILASFYVLVPFAVLPALFTLPAMLGAAPVRRIPILATIGASVALPISIFIMWMPACVAVRDCP